MISGCKLAGWPTVTGGSYRIVPAFVIWLAGKLKFCQRVGSIEPAPLLVPSVTVNIAVGIAVDKVLEIDAVEIDLVRSGKGAVFGKTKYHPVERGGLIQLQDSCRTIKGDG